MNKGNKQIADHLALKGKANFIRQQNQSTTGKP